MIKGCAYCHADIGEGTDKQIVMAYLYNPYCANYSVSFSYKGVERLIKKLVLGIVACTVLISLCKGAAMASQEQMTGEKTMDEIIYLGEEDAILNNFLSLHLMSEDFEMSKPEVRFIMTQEQNGNLTQVSDKLSCTVYRFIYEKYGEQVCQTIVDLSSNQKMKVGVEDYLYLEADDFLWLHSPIVGEVWTKMNYKMGGRHNIILIV